jgi:acyl carrier protein
LRTRRCPATEDQREKKVIVMREAMMLEAQVRRIVADQLGVDATMLTPETLLADDLGVDSLDLAELGCALESELEVRLADRVMAALRTYGDLVGAAGGTIWQRGTSSDLNPGPGVVVRARVIAGGRPANGQVVRAGCLDPYLAEVIAEDALRSGGGTVLDLRVVPEADDEDVGAVRARFGWLADRGVRVSVGRDGNGRARSAFSAR